MRWIAPLLLAFVPAVWCVSTENSTLYWFPNLPECAVSCYSNAVAASTCNLTKASCVCSEETILGTAEGCAAVACSVKDLLTTMNATATNCGHPVRDKTQKFINVTIILGVLTGVVMAARVASKIFISGLDWGLDDVFIIITFVCGLPSTAMNVHGTAGHGEGRDIWTLEFDDITSFSFYFYVLEVFYFAQVSLLKMALLMFYIRIFVGSAQKILWGTVVFNAVYGTVFVFVAIFQCRPVSYFWTGWDGEHSGKCMNTNAIGWANASISVILDVWMLAVPLWCLRSLKLHWKKKLAIATMFIVGTFVTVVSIVRLRFIVNLGSSHNPTYDQTELSIWSTVEINVGIMCVCLPTLRILLTRMFPALKDSMSRSNKNPSYGTEYGWKSRSRIGGSRSHALVELPSREEPITPPDHGIQVKMTFGIRHSDGDEISLVDKGSVDTKSATNAASINEVPR